MFASGLLGGIVVKLKKGAEKDKKEEKDNYESSFEEKQNIKTGNVYWEGKGKGTKDMIK